MVNSTQQFLVIMLEMSLDTEIATKVEFLSMGNALVVELSHGTRNYCIG